MTDLLKRWPFALCLSFFACTHEEDLGGRDQNGNPPTDAGDLPGATALRVFITRTGYTGDLKGQSGATSGTSGADSLCYAAASAAGLGGEWRAWVSERYEDAIDRIVDEGPWYLVDRRTLAFPNR